MSLKTTTWERVKGLMSEDLTKKVTNLVEVKGRYMSNIENDVRRQDPDLANQILDELEQIQYQIKELR
jgi:2C-methyl-D-erythritol 2,4-cyclodiphosphate synthase